MTIESNRAGQVLEIVIHRGQSLNAFDTEHLLALEKCLDLVASDKSIRVLLIRGSGRAFSVGSDIKEMNTMDDSAFAGALCSAEDFSCGTRHKQWRRREHHRLP